MRRFVNHSIACFVNELKKFNGSAKTFDSIYHIT